MKIIFIINPTAGKGAAKKLLPKIEYELKNQDTPYEIWETTAPGHATSLAKRGVQLGCELIVAVGGDGTIFEVANALAYTNTKLGIIPAGSGNDLSRTLDIPFNCSEAIALLLNGNCKTIDLAKVNDSFYFLNISSMGLDAKILQDALPLRKIFSGKIAYTVSTLKNIITYKPIPVTLHLDNDVIQKEVLLVSIANGKYYGGGMKIAPAALIDDGYFDIYLIEKASKLKIALLFPLIFFGKHIHAKEVLHYRSKEIKLYTSTQNLLNLDGEIQQTKMAHYKILPKALHVIC